MGRATEHGADGSDRPWWAQRGEAPPPMPYAGHEVRSQYVALADGTRVAIDLFLPKGLPPEERLTTVFSATPYFRRFAFRFGLAEKLMARAFTGGGANWWPALARHGYAVVVLEQRGSGASFGTRSLDPAAEVRDMTDVVDWVVAQPWSDGKVAPIGVSAMGLTTQMLLSSGHPALVAGVPMFAAFDLFAGSHPGGLMFNRSLENIGDAMRAMDNNRLGELSKLPLLRLLMTLLVRGLRPVDDDKDGRLLAEAVKQHAANEYIDLALLSIEYRDEPMEGTAATITIDDRSPSSYADGMRASGAAISGYTGWWDSASALEMLQLFTSVANPGSRLVIGPWGHAGTRQVGPGHSGKTPSQFDYAADVARFLNKLRDGASGEPTVHYFTLGEDAWKQTTRWPPPADEVTMYFGEQGVLSAEPASSAAADELRLTDDVGSGPTSRWALETHPMKGVAYADRRSLEARLVTYTTAPLPNDTEVTGHPLLSLWVESASPDGLFIAYLEEVTADGTVNYVTEGCLRGAHHAMGGPGPYEPVGSRVPRWFRSADAQSLPTNQAIEVRLDLQPISYLFRAGSSVRLSIAGGDRDNFHAVGNPARSLRILRGPGQQSWITLPLIRRDS